MKDLCMRLFCGTIINAITYMVTVISHVRGLQALSVGNKPIKYRSKLFIMTDQLEDPNNHSRNEALNSAIKVTRNRLMKVSIGLLKKLDFIDVICLYIDKIYLLSR